MLKRSISWIVIITFAFSLIGPYKPAHADILNLPAPGTMVNLSPAYEPTLIKGLTVHKDNPFLFDFIVDTGHSGLSGDALKKEGDRLVKYFFACLTIPEKDLWVNLSPYEKDRMVPQALGQTALGRDLLAQDYILKQLSASLIYPEKNLGKDFWNRVYAKSQAMFGTTQIPVNTFNKVWIVADKASVYEHGQTAFVIDGHLKVMLEEDYLALQKHSKLMSSPNALVGDLVKQNLGFPTKTFGNDNGKAHSIASNIIRQIVLPELEKEVNTGKNFALLRQIFYAEILSTWYKKNLKEALLNQVYADKSTVNGINLKDPSVKERIYQQYLMAYKKGVFNYIKEDQQADGQNIPRKYFSGGCNVGTSKIEVVETSPSAARAVHLNQVYDFATLTGLNGASPAAAKVEIANNVINEPFYVMEQTVQISRAYHDHAMAGLLLGVLSAVSVAGLFYQWYLNNTKETIPTVEGIKELIDKFASLSNEISRVYQSSSEYRDRLYRQKTFNEKTLSKAIKATTDIEALNTIQAYLKEKIKALGDSSGWGDYQYSQISAFEEITNSYLNPRIKELNKNRAHQDHAALADLKSKILSIPPGSNLNQAQIADLAMITVRAIDAILNGRLEFPKNPGEIKLKKKLLTLRDDLTFSFPYKMSLAVGTFTIVAAIALALWISANGYVDLNTNEVLGEGTGLLTVFLALPLSLLKLSHPIVLKIDKFLLARAITKLEVKDDIEPALAQELRSLLKPDAAMTAAQINALNNKLNNGKLYVDGRSIVLIGQTGRLEQENSRINLYLGPIDQLHSTLDVVRIIHKAVGNFTVEQGVQLFSPEEYADTLIALEESTDHWEMLLKALVHDQVAQSHQGSAKNLRQKARAQQISTMYNMLHNLFKLARIDHVEIDVTEESVILKPDYTARRNGVSISQVPISSIDGQTLGTIYQSLLRSNLSDYYKRQLNFVMDKESEFFNTLRLIFDFDKREPKASPASQLFKGGKKYLIYNGSEAYREEVVFKAAPYFSFSVEGEGIGVPKIYIISMDPDKIRSAEEIIEIVERVTGRGFEVSGHFRNEVISLFNPAKDAAMTVREEIADLRSQIEELEQQRSTARLYVQSPQQIQGDSRYWPAVRQQYTLELSSIESQLDNLHVELESIQRNSRNDLAMATAPGGIDLNSANMIMTVTKDANGGVKVNFDPAMIAIIRQRGVQSAIPVIINVTSVSAAQLRPLLGFSQ